MKKISVSLLYGLIFSFIGAFLTKKTKYYRIGKQKTEITKYRYDEMKNKNYDNIYYDTIYNSTFVIIFYISGIGIGFLCQDKVKNISINLKNKIKN